MVSMVADVAATLKPIAPHYQFFAGHPDYCGTGGFRLTGYETDSVNWIVHGNMPPNGGNWPGDFLSFSWDLTDEIGTLASGSWDSTTNTSTGGTTGADFAFSLSRIPVGELYFQATGSYMAYPCGQNFKVTSATGFITNGWFQLTFQSLTDNIVFYNTNHNLALQIPNGNPADYVTPDLEQFKNLSHQKWNLSTLPAQPGPGSNTGYYRVDNSATGKPLNVDINNPNAIFQLQGTTFGWRFVSAGDGTWFVVYDKIASPTLPLWQQYAMGSSVLNFDVEAFPKPFTSSQKWTFWK